MASWLSVTLLCNVQAQQAQRRRQQTQPPSGYYLPKATFPSYAGSAGVAPGSNNFPSSGASGDTGYGGASPSYSQGQMQQDLPKYNGLHLDGSMSRAQGSVAPYDAGEPRLGGALIRWDSRRFPLRIWISEGKKLPDVPWDAISQDRPRRVYDMLADARSLNALPAAPGWDWHMNEWTANGFEKWRPLEQQGVISYVFVDDPTKADVLVFFTEHFTGADGPGGTSVHGLTSGQAFTAEQVAQKTRLGDRPWPLVMELKVSPDERRLTGDAAHEFGHALGIKAHSEYNNDIMYANRIVDDPSGSDFATLRNLYKQTPKYWHY
ncbi:MAG TPA: matrixin family metalloprotease [Candidatus Obscuribacterales bacterium]